MARPNKNIMDSFWTKDFTNKITIWYVVTKVMCIIEMLLQLNKKEVFGRVFINTMSSF